MKNMLLAILLLAGGSAFAAGPLLFKFVPAPGFSAQESAKFQAIQARPSSKTVFMVDIDVDALNSNLVRMTFPSGKTVQYAKLRDETVDQAKTYIWYGQASIGGGSLTIAVGPKGIIVGSAVEPGEPPISFLRNENERFTTAVEQYPPPARPDNAPLPWEKK